MKEIFKDALWTYGSHEPVSMYLRGRRRWTAGLEGGALWLPEWHRKYDSEECVKKMAELGMNILHCRFYKGMGWEFEKSDFPNVIEFTGLCHRYGIRVLGYVQYSTLYYEVMSNEIPDLLNWAALDENGKPYLYVNEPVDYYRWMHCTNNPAFTDYLRKIISIGYNEAGFDGFLFDNCLAAPCRCPRCRGLFRKYLAETCKPEDFGLPNFKFVEPPSQGACNAPEYKDPLVIVWAEFRARSNHDMLLALHDHIKSLDKKLIVSGNVPAAARIQSYRMWGEDYFKLTECFDLIMSQSGNEPNVNSDGAIISRVREAMMGEAAHSDIFVLADGGADSKAGASNIYAQGLMESKVFQTIPTDRIIMTPARGGTPRYESMQERSGTLAAFRLIAKKFRDSFYTENYAPIGVLYSIKSQHLSLESFHQLQAVQEALLRAHIPFRLIISDGELVSELDKVNVLITAGAGCLSEAELRQLNDFAKEKILIVDPQSGDNDEENRQRAKNPFSGNSSSRIIHAPAMLHRTLESDWQFIILPPENAKELIDLIPELPFKIEMPEHVFVRVGHENKRWTFHFINYAHSECVSGNVVLKTVPKSAEAVTFSRTEPEKLPVKTCRISVPAFSVWAMLTVEE